MSQKLILVKYELEDDIPIDESSDNLKSTYVPDEFIDWITEKQFLSEIKIKESARETADVPISVINDNKDNYLKIILQYVDAQLIKHIETAHSHISEGLIISKELNNDFSTLHIWLEVRKVLKEKEEKYCTSQNIKLVIG